MFGKQQSKSNTELEFFTIYDSKSQTYSSPFPEKNSEVVLRDFANAFRDPEAPKKNRYYQNAEDFSLFKLGSFDVNTGEMQATKVVHVANLHDIRAMSQPAIVPMRDVNGPGAL